MWPHNNCATRFVARRVWSLSSLRDRCWLPTWCLQPTCVRTLGVVNHASCCCSSSSSLERMLILHLTRAYRSLSQADSQRAAAECLSPIGRKRSRGAVLSPTPEKRARGEHKQDTSTPSKAQETEETTMVSAKLASNESSSPAAASPSSMLQIGRRFS